MSANKLSTSPKKGGFLFRTADSNGVNGRASSQNVSKSGDSFDNLITQYEYIIEAKIDMLKSHLNDDVEVDPYVDRQFRVYYFIWRSVMERYQLKRNISIMMEVIVSGDISQETFDEFAKYIDEEDGY